MTHIDPWMLLIPGPTTVPAGTAVEDAATSAGPDLDAATTRATRMPHRLKQELRALPLEELRERVAVSGPRLPACLASSCHP
jgi:hypothetical protein